MKLSQLVANSTHTLSTAGIASAQREAELLASHVLDISLSDLFAKSLSDYQVTSEQLMKITELVNTRARRIPLQHLLGKWWFRAYELKVGPGVFSPRPETEQVVDIALKLISNLNLPVVVDVGTGSGAIAISIAVEHPGSKVFAIETSAAAIRYAQENIELLAPGVNLIHADFEEALPKIDNLDLLVSNPPYIPLEAIPRDPEVRNHDPEIALYSGEDGLDAIRLLARLGLSVVKPGGFILLEHADSQSSQVIDLLLSEGWKDAVAHKDLTGRDRAVSAVR